MALPLRYNCVTLQSLNKKIFFLAEFRTNSNPDVVELVDTPDLGSGAVRCVGSSPIIRT